MKKPSIILNRILKSNETKKTKKGEIMYIDGRNNHVENRIVILYNDTVEQCKGCSAAW